jgi:hypothetical protein
MIDKLLSTIDWSDPHYDVIFAQYQIYVYMKKSDGTVLRWALMATLDLLKDLDNSPSPAYNTCSLADEDLWRSLAE